MELEKGLKGKYCECNNSHLSCPEDIMSARCMYCGKQPYAVVLKWAKWYAHKSNREMCIEQEAN